MKIVKCSKCGKYIHIADQCLYCGNTVGFDEVITPQIHENVVDEYSQVEFLVKSRKFDEASSLSNKVIEWMPNFAGIFWLRLLAKKRCSSTVELLGKGFNCEDNADFCNALKFAIGAEQTVYLDIKNLVITARKRLKEEILNHEFNCKLKTDILQIKNSMKSEINMREEKLLSLWSDLEYTENALYALEMDCKLLSKEYYEALEKSEQAATSIKTETYRLEECTEENLYKYQIRIGNAIQQSEQAKSALESMKNDHPWVKKFNELVSLRDGQVRLLTTELSSLKNYGETIQQTLSEIDKIENCHRKSVRMVENYDFRDAYNLLGKECFNRIFHNMGIYQEIQLDVRDVSVQESGTQSKNTTSIFGVEVENPNIIKNLPHDEADTDNYGSVWSVSNDVY